MTFIDSDPPPSTDTPTGGTLIAGRYRVIEPLGQGGMGTVYRVHDSATHQSLALKQLILKDDGAYSKQAASLFEREYSVLAQLSHPRVIAVYDYGVTPSGPFYTMELLDGGDLRELAPMSVSRTCAVIGEVCSSIALLHARRLVHRDITPRNIRCTRDGHAKLIDFGAMVPMGPCTQTVGTPAFIAPETVNHSTLDARTDLFSLGATLYYTLTGRAPFAVQRLSDLRDAWGMEVVPPSRIVPAIPPALDALCLSLLRVDPAQRPRTAFEVIQRLQAIAGVEIQEPEDVAQAYLTTPALIGREETLRQFRGNMRRAVYGQGCTALLEGAPGLGRSRLLDACVIEAKTLGATVLRAAASTSEDTAFATARQLLEQLLAGSPELALAAASSAGVHELLLSTKTDPPRLRAWDSEFAVLQAAIAAWLERICETHALMIVIDDVPSADEASVALLATLALEAHDLRLLICISDEERADAREAAPHALKVLYEHARRERLTPLSRGEIEALLASMFGQVPHLHVLAERLFQLALGNPRDTIELARRLVATRLIRYADGQWTLPSTLEPGDLPKSLTEALMARIAALPPLARRLVEAQALAGNVMRREDYALLAGDADAATLDAAISTLLAQEILQCDADRYSLSQRALGDAARALLSAEDRRARHLALYELYSHQPDMHPYLIVHHLLEAEQYERALDLLARYESLGEQKDTDAALRAGAARLAVTLARALELAIALGRPAREAHELRRRLCGIGLLSDDVLSEQYIRAWREQLERDSGLDDYRREDPALEPATRLQRALTAAATRYAQADARERVYRVDEAIKHLAACVVIEILRTWRYRAPSVAVGLSEAIEPFTSLSPTLFVLWRNAQGAQQIVAGRPLAGRERWCEICEQLARVPPDNVRFVNGVRLAAIRMVARQDAAMGRESALDWAKRLDDEPMQRVDAMLLRRSLRLMLGDTERADLYARKAELRARRSPAREPVGAEWAIELQAYELMNDLAGVRRVIEGITPLAARHEGWRIQLQLARGCYEALRGEWLAARAEFAPALAATRPERPDSAVWVEQWLSAAIGMMAVYIGLREFEHAAELGAQTLAAGAARAVDYGLERVAETMAVAEAKLGRFDEAIARVDRVIDRYTELGVRGLLRAHIYMTRARIASWAGQGDGVARFTALAYAEPGADKVLATVATSELAVTQVQPGETSLDAIGRSGALGAAEPLRPEFKLAELRDALDCCSDTKSRAAYALDYLCGLAHGEQAQLYLVEDGEQLSFIVSSDGIMPNSDAIRFAKDFFRQQIDDDADMTTLTHATQMLSTPGAAAYVDERGRPSRLFMLTCKARGTLVYVGLVALRLASNAPHPPFMTPHLAVIAASLLRHDDALGLNAAG
jgi:hypothetical protein